MIVSTADNVPGKSFEILGLVRGNIVTSKNIGRDMMASVKSVVGGEIKSYTEMTDEARQVAEDRMIEQAQRLGLTPSSPCASTAAQSSPAPSR